MPETYSPDGFDSLCFRVERGTRAAGLDNVERLHYGDSVVVRISGVTGVTDASTLDFGIRCQGVDGELADTVSPFQFVPGTKDAVFAPVSLATAAALAAVTGKTLGEPAECRAYLRVTGGRTVMDAAVNVFPQPLFDGASPEAVSEYVTRARLAAIANAVLAMASSNPAQTQAQLRTLLQSLSALA